jgi:hypothetical protein
MPDEPPPKETKIGRIGSAAPVPFPLSEAAKARDTAGKGLQYHDMRKGAIEQEYRAVLEAARTDWENAEFAFDELSAALQRHPTYWQPPLSWFYWPALALLALAQWPISGVSFEFFGDTTANAALMAVLLGVLTVSLSHLLGMTAQRFTHACARFASGVWAGVRFAFAALMIVGLCYGAAIFRQGFSEQFMAPNASIQGLLTGGADAAIVALHTTLSPSGMLFFALSLGVNVCAFFLAFFRHDPHPTFERLDRDRKRLQRAYLGISRKQGAELAAEDRRFAAEVRRKGWRIPGEA